MTNGEKMKELFPQGIISYSGIFIIFDINGYCQQYSPNWWNAEYKEPTNTIDYRRAFKIACVLLNGDILYGVDTDKIYELMMQKDDVVSSSSYEEYILNHLQELDQGQYITENCIACKYDETEEEDGEHCKKCLAGDNQFELDKELVAPTENDLVVSRYLEDNFIPTTKNDLGVDAVSRKAVLNTLDNMDSALNEDRTVETYKELLKECYKVLPSVTPQPCEDAISRKKVLNQIFYSTDNSGDVVLGSELRSRIERLPSVTPQEQRWIPVSERLPEANIYDGHGPVWKHEVLITGYLSYDDKKETFVNMAFAEDVRNKCVPNTNVTAWIPLPKAYREVEE